MGEPLRSLAAYSHFVAEAVDRPTVNRSTVAVWSESSYTGTAEGEIWFSNGLRLRIREEIDFHAGLITSYGYEVYRVQERLYWYDDFPHAEPFARSAETQTCSWTAEWNPLAKRIGITAAIVDNARVSRPLRPRV